MTDKLSRIIEARAALRARFEEQIARTPSLSDSAPQGTGSPNRHGMPKLPVGQTQTSKWPVLDLGIQPNIEKSAWRLVIDGACEEATELDFQALAALPQVEDVSDFHCVTTWSRMDLKWGGVRFSELAALVRPLPAATHVMCHGYDGYSTNVALVELLKDDVLVVHTVLGAPLAREHGGPVRMITPQLYAWKGAKWLSRIEFMTENRLGFWEQRGYSSTAFPWRNDRYG